MRREHVRKRLIRVFEIMKVRINSTLFVIILTTLRWTTCWADSATQAMQNPARSSDSGPPQKPYYLTGNEDVWRNFPPKPALGSPVDQADLLITLSLQASRTEEQKNEALRDKSYDIKLMTGVVDADFEHRFPNVLKVLQNADIDSYYINSMIKDENARLRPFVQHPTLVIPLFTTGDFSYPSGHSSGMELQARILAELFPEKTDALVQRARQIADSRVVAGVHYASDTEAGLTLGDLIFTELKSKGAFEKDLTKAAETDKTPGR
jgi:acid phosphatase (class A)